MSMISKTFFPCRFSHYYCLPRKKNAVLERVIFLFFSDEESAAPKKSAPKRSVFLV